MKATSPATPMQTPIPTVQLSAIFTPPDDDTSAAAIPLTTRIDANDSPPKASPGVPVQSDPTKLFDRIEFFFTHTCNSPDTHKTLWVLYDFLLVNTQLSLTGAFQARIYVRRIGFQQSQKI